MHQFSSNPYTVSLFQIKTPAQLEAAFSFFATTGPENFKLSEFEEACGVGTVTMGHLSFFVFFLFLVTKGHLFGHKLSSRMFNDTDLLHNALYLAFNASSYSFPLSILLVVAFDFFEGCSF